MSLTERESLLVQKRTIGSFAGIVSTRVAIVFVVVALSATLTIPRSASAQQESESQPVYFEESGHVLSGAFLDAWFTLGGPDRTGHPVSPAMKIGDNWVQWFEYARFEVTSDSFEGASADAVYAAPVGLNYAQRFGYTQRHDAFATVASGGDGSRYFEEVGHSLANAFLDSYENGMNAEYLGLPISEEFSINGTVYQFFEYGALSWAEATGTVFVPVGTLEAMLHGTLGNRVEKPESASIYSHGLFALRGQYTGERWIEVNLATYSLTAWAGDTPVMTTLIVSGASSTPTVTGEFRVYWKLATQTMVGAGPDGIEYEQEDVPDVMYFFQDWAIHGAYWRSTFGYAASHGCVNVPLDQAEWLYEWASVGTRVVVHT